MPSPIKKRGIPLFTVCLLGIVGILLIQGILAIVSAVFWPAVVIAGGLAIDYFYNQEQARKSMATGVTEALHRWKAAPETPSPTSNRRRNRNRRRRERKQRQRV